VIFRRIIAYFVSPFAQLSNLPILPRGTCRQQKVPRVRSPTAPSFPSHNYPLSFVLMFSGDLRNVRLMPVTSRPARDRIFSIHAAACSRCPSGLADSLSRSGERARIAASPMPEGSKCRGCNKPLHSFLAPAASAGHFFNVLHLVFLHGLFALECGDGFSQRGRSFVLKLAWR